MNSSTAALTRPPSQTHGLLNDLEPQIEQTDDGFTQLRPLPKKILLADDDPGIREMLGRVLESENYEVVSAKNGNEAAAKFVSWRPDLVLLDLNMPDRDGWSAFRFMAAAHPSLRVIIITARPNQSEKANELGADAIMEKPLNLPALLEAMKGLLAESEATRSLRITSQTFKTACLPRQK